MNSIRKLAESTEHMLLSIEREIVIMKLIDHPNIMRLYDVWETSTELYLILEYVEGGELFDYLCNKGRLSTFEALAYFQQIISAVDYCHRLNIAHRDLKPENLLMDQNKNIKVADFGMAAWQAGSKNGLLQTACGSPHYAAPEVIMGKEYDGRAADIWSCGVILFALLAGRLPFDDDDLPTLLDKVKSGTFEIPSGMDASAKDLISRMLQKDVVKRITIPEILLHPFFLSQESKSIDAYTPKLNDIARPLSAGEEIDRNIFANLCTLWYGTLEADIEASLKSPEPNWQKGVYWLLIEYQDNHLRSFEEDVDSAHGKKPKKISTANERQRKTMSSSQRPYLTRTPSFLPPRVASPVSPKTAGCELHGDDSDYVQLEAPGTSPHSSPPLRPGTDLCSGEPLSPSHIVSLPPLLSPTRGSANLPVIQAPGLMDDEMQHLFEQIVEHLGANQEPTAGALDLSLGTPSTLPMHNTMESGKHQQTRTTQARSRSSHQVTPPDADASRGKQSKLREANQEDLPLAPSGTAIIKSCLRGEKRPALRVQIIEPSPRTLRKKRDGDAPTAISAFSEGSSMPSSMSRRRWLDNVFKLKPTTYQLLSTCDGFTTREECHRILVNLGVHVVLTHADITGVLKCRTDGTKNLSGFSLSVRFRIEVQKPTFAQIAAGYRVVLHLTQERGSLSSFQSIYNKLRKSWKLDAPPRGNRTGRI